MITYSIYLVEANSSELLRSSVDPHEVRRVARSKKLARRLRKQGVHIRIEKDGRTITPVALDTICYQQWLENPTHHTPWT